MQKPGKQHSISGMSPTAENARLLLSELRQRRIKHSEISAATKIHQSQVSRLLRGDFKTVNGHALELCKYASRILAITSRPTSEIREELIKHVLDLWDGSEQSGQKIIGLLNAIKNFSEVRS